MRARAGLVVIALCWACQGEDLSGVEWSEAAVKDLVVSVEVTGKLAAVNSTSLGPPLVPGLWNFKISFMADEGEDVTEGTPVLGFDQTELRRSLEQKENERDSAIKELAQHTAEAAMTAAKVELDIAEAEGRLRKARLKASAPEDLGKAIEIAKAKLDLELAAIEVEYLKKKLEDTRARDRATASVLSDRRDRATGRVEELQANMASLMVTAPNAGTVIFVTNWRGEKRKVGESVWRGNKVVEIAGLGKMEGRGTVDEVDFARVSVGQKVELELDANPDVTYGGRLQELSTTLTRKSRAQPTKVAEVKIAIDEHDAEAMRPGMRFRGRIEVERIAAVLTIPTAALFVAEEGSVAFREVDGGYERVSIEVGRRNDREIEVVSGLNPGDRVATAALEALQ